MLIGASLTIVSRNTVATSKATNVHPDSSWAQWLPGM